MLGVLVGLERLARLALGRFAASALCQIARCLADFAAMVNDHNTPPFRIDVRYTTKAYSNMANEKNLRPQSSRTKSEQRRIASKGGKASAAKRRERKALKESLGVALDIALSGKVDTDLSKIDFADALQAEGLSMQDKIAVAMIAEAANGNVRAAEFIRDTMGEKPVEKLDITGDIAQAEKDIAAHIRKRKRSGKS